MKYKVHYSFLASYDVTVEAENEESAMELAEEEWLDADVIGEDAEFGMLCNAEIVSTE